MLQRKASVSTVLSLVGLTAGSALAGLITRLQTVPLVVENAAGSNKGWQAVAPGRVEPLSSEIKITAVVVALVSEVLVKANDKVFAGEPLIRLKDDEVRARLAAAGAKVDLRGRARCAHREYGSTVERQDER